MHGQEDSTRRWWESRSPLCPCGQLGTLGSGLPGCWENVREERVGVGQRALAGGHPAVGCYTTGPIDWCRTQMDHTRDLDSQCDSTPSSSCLHTYTACEGGHNCTSQSRHCSWGPSLALIQTDIPGPFNYTAPEGPDPWAVGGPSVHRPVTALGTDGGDSSQYLIGCCHQLDPCTESQGCVCVYGQGRTGRLSHCWGVPPLYYDGGSRAMIVGIEVDIVEEVAIENTEMLEVISDGSFTQDLLNVVMHDGHLLPM
ncbi:uncharacterized protein LOC130118635 isoform X1 [Lampris incognitus]|uniref:uncharacterized protein LOC130118635 isoform X1 n=1 Tax=Lampris incognitus TaxID=2546036 RepID=UPI0024B62AD2|nr:uncharacterized protein LOC130118635 isoform X1 [Lampris incognitus]XP_056143051.1 uncharacterized protein LOC130118635 isoform X1 [Lampris incognitus]